MKFCIHSLHCKEVNPGMNKEDVKGISLFIRLAFIVYQIFSHAHEKKMNFHTQMRHR